MIAWGFHWNGGPHHITYITLHYRHFKRHLHLKWPVVHQQSHVIRNTAHRPSTQASYTASRVRPKRKISCAAAQIAATQIAATLTISFPWWRHMSLTSYWGQQRMSLTSYPGHTPNSACSNVWLHEVSTEMGPPTTHLIVHVRMYDCMRFLLKWGPTQGRHFNFFLGPKFFFIFQCHRTIEKIGKIALYM